MLWINRPQPNAWASVASGMPVDRYRGLQKGTRSGHFLSEACLEARTVKRTLQVTFGAHDADVVCRFKWGMKQGAVTGSFDKEF
jgi:hypothetical protein